MNRSTSISTDADTSRSRDFGSPHRNATAETALIAASVLGLVALYGVMFLTLTGWVVP